MHRDERDRECPLEMCDHAYDASPGHVLVWLAVIPGPERASTTHHI